tara:strand:- start:324 stop:572 length:249 start_codon:yes stop_codon:yes gene_type:complete
MKGDGFYIPKWVARQAPLIITLICSGIWAYAQFENKVATLEMKMEEANEKIEQLIAKHIIEEEERFEEMQEQVKWYQRIKKK